MEIRIAVVGTFWLSENFVKAIDRTKGVCLAAVCSRSLEKARAFVQNREGVKLYDDPAALANDTQIDAVYIATPNMTHYALSKQMLLSGKHVLCEKPITVTENEYCELLSLAKEKNLVYLEAMMSAHLPQLAVLKETLLQAGKVVTARLDFSQRSSKIDRVVKGERFSSFSKDCFGGALMDLGVYAVYLSLMLFGYPKNTEAFCVPILDVDGTDTVLLTYENFNVVITLSKLAESRIRSEIICEKGTITTDLISQLQNIRYYPVKGEPRLLYGENESSRSMDGELFDFLRYIKGEDYTEMQMLAQNSVKLLQQLREKIGYDKL